MRIGIDAEGGDRPVSERVKGAVEARANLADEDRIVLVGPEAEIREALEAHPDGTGHIEVLDAPERIGMDEAPVEAIRGKPHSPIPAMTQMHREGRLDAVISAGNTGAVVAAAQMRLHRLRNVHRPGIAIVTPTPHGPVALCDVGANVNCRPQHLHQYGLMASLYLRELYGKVEPRVGLLSVGEEDVKGNQLVKHTRELLRDDPNLTYVGNVEGRDVFSGVCDVMVCEGFVGNVVLKLMEGMAQGLIKTVVSELAKALPHDAEAIHKASRNVNAAYDFNEYGGAPLLGVAGISIICHGTSDYRGIANAVQVAKVFAEHQVNEKIIQALA